MTQSMRVRLTTDQKRMMCEHKANNSVVSLRKMCKWTKEQFNLNCEPPLAALLMLFKRPVAADAASIRPKRKTN